MSADLDATLNELGDEYRILVAKLRSSASDACIGRRRAFASLQTGRFAAMMAAALAIAVSVFVMMGGEGYARRDSAAPAVSLKVPSNPYARLLCIAHKSIFSEIIQTQNSDGSWQNDYLTRQNAAALRVSGESGVSYRKALRYLRQKGLVPLTDEEFFERQALAASKGHICYTY